MNQIVVVRPGHLCLAVVRIAPNLPLACDQRRWHCHGFVGWRAPETCFCLVHASAGSVSGAKKFGSMNSM
ncbi:MAG TPA: hypothetical protein PLY77_06210, partial [Plasticicumulans sp.]|nr:hypothetical protein [Plasticicumulans sp.]